jgi:hypothetical protein
VSELDRGRLARILGMCGSDHAGERAAAAQQADKLIRSAGMTWLDLLAPLYELRIAVQAARQLLDENAALQAELDQYRSAVPATRDSDWYEMGDHRAQARWVLDLADRNLLRLNDFERGFLGTVSRWRGDLIDRQQPI